MKKAISVLLTFAIMLTMCSCSLLTYNYDPAQVEEITELDFSDRYIYNAVFIGDSVVIMSVDGDTDGDTDGDYADGEDIPMKFRLTVFNVSRRKMTAQKDYSYDGAAGAEMSANGESIEVLLYYSDGDDGATRRTFDLSLNELGSETVTPTGESKSAAEISELITDDFLIFDNYCCFTTDNSLAFMNTDDPNSLYITPVNEKSTVISAYKNTAAVMCGSELYAVDFGEKIVYPSVTATFSADDISSCAMNENYVFAIETKNDEYGYITDSVCYVWNYFAGEPAAKNDIDIFGGDADFSDKINELTDEIKDEYLINIIFAETTDETADFGGTDEVVLQNDKTVQYLTVSVLKYYMSLFPDGFFKTLSEKALGGEALPVYPVDSLGDDDGVTVANSEIAVITSFAIMKETFAHELTHVMETVFYDEYFADNPDYWTSLNPDGFEYDDTYEYYNNDSEESTLDYIFFYDEDNSGAYFYNRYSKTFENEDRAVIFAHLFAYDTYNGEWLDAPHLKAKADALCAMIKDCFDLNEADDIYWEQYL